MDLVNTISYDMHDNEFLDNVGNDQTQTKTTYFQKPAFSTGFEVLRSLDFSFMVLHVQIYHSLIFKTWISILIT